VAREGVTVIEHVIVAETPIELAHELALWARKTAASRLNDSGKYPRTATARRLVAEASTYNDVADFIDGLKIKRRFGL